jgi:glycosyltransferase involved in cell wall biosynthesis
MTQHDLPFLTIILAVKEPDAAQFDSCIASIAALRNSFRFDLVIVVSGKLPEISDTIKGRLHTVRVVDQEPRGVYPAYNRGLEEIRSTYVMVMGCDDLLLPGLDKVLDSIPTGQLPHIVAARVLMQDIGVVGPSRVRWGLIFRNWCQQGLLYRTDIFSSRRFDCKYPIQADHKLNMEVVSNPAMVIQYRNDIICHFSSSGLSQKAYDWVFREDMPNIVRTYYGPFFWIVALTKRKLADIFKRRSGR